MRIFGVLVLLYITVGLVADAAVGVFQPQGKGTVLLRTFDSEGHEQGTVLTLLNDEGDLWLQSSQWFRGWYNRLVANPDVELVRGGRVKAYQAAPVDTPESQEIVARLSGRGESMNYWFRRALSLWAPIKPVQLFPRAAEIPESAAPPKS